MKTETGWSKEFPKVDGAYWLRFADPESQACIVEVVRGVVFQTGVVGDIRNRVDIDECEWLPASPADAEQLAELRQTARRALKLSIKLFEHFMGPHACGDFTCDCGGCGLCEFRRESNAELKQLRAVLNPKPEKETQS